MKLAIVKYNAGNIQSVIYALNRIGIEPILTDDIDELKSADKVLFPGQGEASNAMKYLRSKGLDQVIKDLNTDCLGIIPAMVKKFPPQDKVPQMGWNTITDVKSPLFKGIEEGSFVYFVHSYYVESNPYQIGTTDYILPYACALQKDNFYAVQFHPEKSSDVGEQILKNFIELQ
jgi:glutamine amidotransferase